jgi:hypothetical protein
MHEAAYRYSVEVARADSKRLGRERYFRIPHSVRGWTETATGDWTRSSMGLGIERIKRTVATFLNERAAAT